MPDLIATLVSLVLSQPLQAQIGANFGGAGMPQAVVAAGAANARPAAPVIVERAERDLRWAAAGAVRLGRMAAERSSWRRGAAAIYLYARSVRMRPW